MSCWSKSVTRGDFLHIKNRVQSSNYKTVLDLFTKIWFCIKMDIVDRLLTNLKPAIAKSIESLQWTLQPFSKPKCPFKACVDY